MRQSKNHRKNRKNNRGGRGRGRSRDGGGKQGGRIKGRDKGREVEEDAGNYRERDNFHYNEDNYRDDNMYTEEGNVRVSTSFNNLDYE